MDKGHPVTYFSAVMGCCKYHQSFVLMEAFILLRPDSLWIVRWHFGSSTGTVEINNKYGMKLMHSLKRQPFIILWEKRKKNAIICPSYWVMKCKQHHHPLLSLEFPKPAFYQAKSFEVVASEEKQSSGTN